MTIAARTSSADTTADRVRFRIVRHPKVVAGFVILTVMTLLALLHPVFQATIWADEHSVYNPLVGYDTAISHPSASSTAHWLGTDALGRDVFSLVTYALGPSLWVAAIVSIVVGALSILSGALSAYFRGGTDAVLANLADALSLFPAPIILLVVGIARPDFGVIDLGVLYGLVFGLGSAAVVVRSRALTAVTKPFIDAARVAGGRAGRIIGAHLVPELLPYALVQMMAGVTGALVAEAFVEFFTPAGGRIGLGSLVYQGLAFHGLITNEVAWFQLASGSLAISLLAGAFYLLSVGIREATDPRLFRTYLQPPAHSRWSKRNTASNETV